VELDDVQVVSLHTPQALVDGVQNILPAVVVQPRKRDAEAGAFTRGELADVQWASALGGEDKGVTAARQALANMRFGLAVVYSHVNVVDPSIQDRVQDASRLAWHERPANTGDHTAQLQRAEAERGHVQASAAEGALGKVWHSGALLSSPVSRWQGIKPWWLL
jgi:hypothetical protein